MTDTPSRILAEATDYTSLLDAFRARAAELGIARLEIDEIGGLASGYAAKLLGPNPIKTFGRIPLLGALALKIVIVEDTDMLPRVAGRISHRNPNAGQRRRPRTRAITVA